MMAVSTWQWAQPLRGRWRSVRSPDFSLLRHGHNRDAGADTARLSGRRDQPARLVDKQRRVCLHV